MKPLSWLISLTASWPIYLGITGALYYFNLITLIIAISLILGFIISLIIIFILRLFIKTKRQDTKSVEAAAIKLFGKNNKNLIVKSLKKFEERSFASGHVARVVIYAGIAYFSLNKLILPIILIIYALFVGMSRVKLKRHRLIDVVFGIIVGIVTIYLLKIFFL